VMVPEHLPSIPYTHVTPGEVRHIGAGWVCYVAPELVELSEHFVKYASGLQG